ncbi:hypothetical protein COHA_003726 [Chlorella ohadii]|uniref:Uncharacterized protein n=1 Tax=Chlorella ohadii TaxID=2649997 RepID=A0AAD5DRY1_9CHLO|nr:hypothetical protein COHA_003726 [Chlorella ohadii]
MNPGLSDEHRQSLIWLAQHQGRTGLLLLARRAWETAEGAAAEQADWQLRFDRGDEEEAEHEALAAVQAYEAQPGEQETAALRAARDRFVEAHQRVAAAEQAHQQADQAWEAAEETRRARRTERDMMPGK